MPNTKHTQTNEPAELVTIPFHGQIILAQLRADGTQLVALKPICINMGIDPEAQRKRLLRQPWAVTSMMEAAGADGKTYNMVGLDRRTFTMWLATIDTSRIKNQQARQLIITYQNEAADALDAYFHESGAIRVQPDDTDTDVLARAVLIATRRIEKQARQVQELTTRVTELEPAAQLGIAFEGAPELMLVRNAAKYLTTAGVPIRERELFAWLVEHHWAYKQNGTYYPKADRVQAGHLRLVPAKPVIHKDGSEFTPAPTMKITRKGLALLYRRLCEERSTQKLPVTATIF